MGAKIITETEVDALAKNGVLEVVRGMILTPLAREHASRNGIRLVYGGGTVPSSEDLPRDPGTGRKGPSHEAIVATVLEEVVRAMSEAPAPRAENVPARSPLASEGVATVLDEAAASDCARAIVVATGLNRPGIAACLNTSISECGTDIQDISQTIVSDFFSMIFVVNLASLASGMTFKAFKEHVEAAGKSVDAEVVVFHESILRAMHRV